MSSIFHLHTQRTRRLPAALLPPQIPGTPKTEHPYPGLTVIRCPTPGWYAQGYYIAYPDRRLFKAVKDADFVLIHSLATLGIIGGITARLLKKKI